jgi:FkbM family methyltransferase
MAERWIVRIVFGMGLGVLLLGGSGAAAVENDFDALLREGKSQHSQGKQELIIRHFFKDRPAGVFVDIGCYQPTLHSTTYYLEKELGWRGIAVDAEASYGPAWRQLRRKSKFFAYAVTDKSGEAITFYAAGPIASVEKLHIEMWEKRLDKDLNVKSKVVPTITMNDLLDREKITKIDFLSMDINGSEPTALSAFDIQRFSPDLVHVEVHPRNRKVLSAYFEKNGYRRIDEYLEFDKINWYFTPKDPKATDVDLQR